MTRTGFPVDGSMHEQVRLVDALAAHFPGLAPAIRAVATHLLDDGSALVDRRSEGCCLAAWGDAAG